ncbi:sensor histidine kinase [Planctomicrobium sp. SH668]|uniref:sensor histidine kinase n=1 Tax=Planctomicrobium sp. SH668 TaxID=3448126 RepID=UPI003F5C7989
MADNVQLFAYGAAAVLDIVLLLSMLERQNWKYVTVWMLLLTSGVWVWHSADFVQALLSRSMSPHADRGLWMSKSVMAFGLLLMPCAMLHGLHRFTTTGIGVAVRSNPWLALYYTPILMIIPISAQLGVAPRELFVDALSLYFWPYVCFMGATNLIVSVGMWRLKQHTDIPSLINFYHAMCLTLVGITLFNVFVLAFGVHLWPWCARYQLMSVALTPCLPTIIFAYYVLRFQLLPIVIERTLTYGAILAGAMLLHQLVMQDIVESFQDEYGINFGIVEGVAVMGLILFYQPLRDRVSEALRYLFGSSSSRRGKNRSISVELAARTGDSPESILDWFTEAARTSFQVETVACILYHSDRALAHYSISSSQVTPPHTQEFPDDVRRLINVLETLEKKVCTRYDAPNQEVLDLMQDANLTAVIRIDNVPQNGLILVGSQNFRQSLSDEELTALILLVEQLQATLHNSRLIEDRAEAERLALQNEKLSSIGLMAGSIAHEVKNPLSSIKAIATVMREELGEASPHKEDLRLIVNEIDRLAQTIAQLLEVARPAERGIGGGSISESLEQTTQLLKHLARQLDVTLDSEIERFNGLSQASTGTLREIFFNLISNAIEAAGRGGTVRVQGFAREDSFIVQIQDTGPGLAHDVQQKLFEPFITTKSTGTGLGLYVVKRRVVESGGKIEFVSSREAGTTFTVTLPAHTTSVSLQLN